MGNSTVTRILSKDKESISHKCKETYRYSELILSGEQKFKELIDNLTNSHEDSNIRRIIEDHKQSKMNQAYDYEEARQIYDSVDNLKGEFGVPFALSWKIAD